MASFWNPHPKFNHVGPLKISAKQLVRLHQAESLERLQLQSIVSGLHAYMLGFGVHVFWNPLCGQVFEDISRCQKRINMFQPLTGVEAYIIYMRRDPMSLFPEASPQHDSLGALGDTLPATDTQVAESLGKSPTYASSDGGSKAVVSPTSPVPSSASNGDDAVPGVELNWILFSKVDMLAILAIPFLLGIKPVTF